MKYHLVTLGCPKNVTDSERLTRALTQAGHVGIDDSDLADLLIVNSCGFIDAAKDESAQTTAALGAAKREDQRLIVVGCWSQIEPEPAAAIPGVERTFGIEAWDEIIGWLGPSDPVDIPETGALTRTSAYLKIADGCSRPCTFCNIPAIKGREFRSATVESLLDEARRLADEGVKELILVAQDSTAYAEDLGQADGLAYLLEQLAREVPQVPWLRLMYAYPGFVSDRLIEAMAGIPQVCHYLDIPLQHGSPSVLKRMKRPHNLRMVHHTLDRLRTAMPDIAIRTTFLVGFPARPRPSSKSCSTSSVKRASTAPAPSPSPPSKAPPPPHCRVSSATASNSAASVVSCPSRKGSPRRSTTPTSAASCQSWSSPSLARPTTTAGPSSWAAPTATPPKSMASFSVTASPARAPCPAFASPATSATISSPSPSARRSSPSSTANQAPFAQTCPAA